MKLQGSTGAHLMVGKGDLPTACAHFLVSTKLKLMRNPPTSGLIVTLFGWNWGWCLAWDLSHDLGLVRLLVLPWIPMEKSRAHHGADLAQVPFPCSSLGPGCLPLGARIDPGIRTPEKKRNSNDWNHFPWLEPHQLRLQDSECPIDFAAHDD